MLCRHQRILFAKNYVVKVPIMFLATNFKSFLEVGIHFFEKTVFNVANLLSYCCLQLLQCSRFRLTNTRLEVAP